MQQVCLHVGGRSPHTEHMNPVLRALSLLFYQLPVVQPLPHPPNLPTFANVAIGGALELSSAQQEAGPVVGVALTTGGGSQAAGGWAALVSQDLVDGGTVLVGQGCGTRCCVAIRLRV